ncbi:hypothetical protein EJB05_08069 [Eragrostis curvula]|uniref:Uncharacterized protein n=1 Tax=Eragrostis curvula TaxID=38414 RepID=A0A5J9WK34_9POAL|nr:hypothetical protein EJB05_08069 [Eragrostis curvula]
MAGRSGRRRGRRAKLESAEDSPAKTSSSSSSDGSTSRTVHRKIPISRLYPPLEEEEEEEKEEEEEAWAESDRRAMRRRLLDIIHRYYLDAISRLPPTELRTTLARGLLVGGYCFGPLHPVHNIIFNSLWYATAYPLGGHIHTGSDSDDDEVQALLSTDGIVRICYRSLDGLLASLRNCCPSLSTGDALWQLFSSGADLAAAIALANGTSKSGGLRVMSSHGLAAFHLGAKTARHPNPTAFAHFASSVLPAVNAKHNIVQFLLMNHGLSTEDTCRLSNLLVPALPHEPPLSPLILSPRVLDQIATRKKQFKDTRKQVLSVVNMALQDNYLLSGEQLMLHSVCGASLLKEEGLNDYYHINFLAHHGVSGSVVGTPVLFFTEATILASDEISILLCVPVDPVADIGCCFACETNKKKVVHPFYNEYHGGREFQVDEVDFSDFRNPVDVDYIFFDADRDRAFASYLDDSTDH